MRRLFTMLMLLAVFVTANAQTQQVHVKTRGRLNADGRVMRGSYIPDATLTLGNGSAYRSDGFGARSFYVIQEDETSIKHNSIHKRNTRDRVQLRIVQTQFILHDALE